GGHDLERLTDLGGAVVVLNGVARAIDRADVCTALEVVLRDIDFVGREAVAQKDHALPCVRCVLAVRESLYERLEGLEGAADIGGRTLRQIRFEPALE